VGRGGPEGEEGPTRTENATRMEKEIAPSQGEVGRFLACQGAGTRWKGGERRWVGERINGRGAGPGTNEVKKVLGVHHASGLVSGGRARVGRRRNNARKRRGHKNSHQQEDKVQGRKSGGMRANTVWRQ